MPTTIDDTTLPLISFPAPLPPLTVAFQYTTVVP